MEKMTEADLRVVSRIGLPVQVEIKSVIVDEERLWRLIVRTGSREIYLFKTKVSSERFIKSLSTAVDMVERIFSDTKTVVINLETEKIS